MLDAKIAIKTEIIINILSNKKYHKLLIIKVIFIFEIYLNLNKIIKKWSY